MIPSANRAEKWVVKLKPYSERLKEIPELIVEGKLSRMVGLTLEAEGCRAAVGSLCRVETKSGKKIGAEVVGFSGGKIFLMPT
jgi:flagellum-specific ATP synthase